MFFVFLLCLLVDKGLSTKPCDIPNESVKGVCVDAENCDAYQNILNNQNATSERIAFLQQIGCEDVDDDPYICCPTNGGYKNPTVKLDVISQITRPKPTEFVNRLGEDDLTNCGEDVSDDRIFGGQITGIDEFPWLAVLFYMSTETNTLEHACGGALVSSRYVLTAAHCVGDKALKNIGPLKKIRLGEYNLNTQPDCIVKHGEQDCAEPPIDFNPQKIIVHKQYDPQSFDKHNDIALIKLDRSAPYTDFIRPICLPSTFSIKTIEIKKRKFTAAGWGRTDYFDSNNPALSNIKLKVHLPLVDSETCKEVYAPAPFRIRVGDSQICAGGQKGYDTCRGDSGSPLMYLDLKLRKWFVYGIVSRGASKCGTKGVPSIYTNVIKLSDWITSNMESD